MSKLVQATCRVYSRGMARSTAPERRFFVTAITLLVAALGATKPRGRAQPTMEVWAFTGPWDSASTASLARHIGALDVAVTGWIALDSATAEPTLPSLYVDHFTPGRERAARFALVTSWHGLSFHPSSIRTLAANPARLGRVARRIADAAHRAGYRGLVLDFEDHAPADLSGLLIVVKAMTDSAHALGLSRVAIAVPAADTAGYPTRALLRATDLLIPMLYDQHWTTSPPGAISDPAWVRSTLMARLAGVDRDRIVAGLGTYAYRWPRGKSGEQLSYAEARRAAASGGKVFVRDGASQTLYATLKNGDQLWANDARLVQTLIEVVKSLGVKRVALWRLGQEDPGIWDVLR
jgi:spore germination protein YaaH